MRQPNKKTGIEKNMITCNSKEILPAPDSFSPRASCWRTGLLLVLLSALLLPGCGKDNPKLKKELEGLKSASATERANALLHLADMGAAAKPAGPRAVELLKDPDMQVKTAAIKLIVTLKHKTPEALAGVGALAGSAHEEHAMACAELLGSKIERLRELGSQGLAQANEHAVVAKTQLIAGLDDKLPYVKANCATALGNLGSNAPPEAKDKLTALLKDPEPMVVDEAKKALEKIK